MWKDKGGRREPQQDGRPRLDGSAGSTLLRLFCFMSPWRGRLILLFAVSFCSIGCDLSLPLAIERCIDAIGGFGFHIDTDGFYAGLGMFAVLFVISAVLDYAQELLNATISTNVEKRLRCELFSRMVRLPLGRRGSKGDWMSRILNDAKLVSTAFSEALLALFSSLVVIAGCTVIMLWKNAMLAGLIILCTLVTALLTYLVSGRLLPRFKEQQDALGELNTQISDGLLDFRAATEGDRLKKELRDMLRKNEAYYRSKIRVYRLEGLLEPLVLLLGNLTFLLIVAVGAGLTIRGKITLGMMQVFIMYFKQLMEPVGELSECWMQVQSALAGAGRIFDILDAAPEPEVIPLPEGKTRDGGECFLRFEDVHFGYRRNIPVLKGFGLCIEKGDNVSIVGRTGAGKTTVLNLLERFYHDYQGSIFLEGRELRSIPLQELRKRVTVIPQQSQVLDATVFENISYGMESPSMEKVRDMARRVGIAERIESQPRQYDTSVSRDNPVFSEGQLQLLCLARALLRDSDILLMDEATSSLDTAVEAMLQEALDKLTKGKTRLTIAHRLSTVMGSDLICVVDEGRICEMGTHQELMDKRGVYYDLFMSQYWGKEI